jgi:hypothetical protein
VVTPESGPSSAALAPLEPSIPAPRGLARKLSLGLVGFAALVAALGGVFWLLTGSVALVAGVMAFYLVVGSLYLIGAWGSTRWLSRINHVAARALEAGRVAEARTLLDQHLLRSAANTPMYAIAIWLRARVAMREGEFEDARDRLEMLLGWHWYERGGLLHGHAPRVRADLVVCLALVGRLDDAQQERRRGESEGETRSRGPEADAHARTWLFADALLLARRERFGELLDRLGQRATLIAQLPCGDRQCLALLHEWARFRLARDEAGFRGPHTDVDMPEPLREVGFEIERVEFMARAWPELREFIPRARTALAAETRR